MSVDLLGVINEITMNASSCKMHFFNLKSERIEGPDHANRF